MDVAEIQTLSLKLLVHKVKNEVVFAEANHDFVDVLFSFMTIPVGAVIKLFGDQSFSCMSNLCSSVENFDENLLSRKTCREVLLHPRSAAEIYCRNLKLNWYETDGNEYYECASYDLVSYYPQNGLCLCGSRLIYELKLPSPSPTLLGGFTKSTTRFMITSDLNVRPISTMKSLTLLKLLGPGEKNVLEERTIEVEKDKILELLKFSLVSKSPLTEAFLELIPLNYSSVSKLKNGPGNVDYSQNMASSSTKTEETISLKLIINTPESESSLFRVSKSPFSLQFNYPNPHHRDLSSLNLQTMDVAEIQTLSLKLLVHKVKNEVVFAEANHDFVDVLFSFMTIPVGAVIKLFGDQSFSCMSNLCSSVENFDENLLSSKTCREVLLHPRSAAEIYCRNLKLNWYETDGNEYYECTSCGLVSYYPQNGLCLCGSRLNYELKLPSPSPTLLGGFTKSTTRFMITSDLNVRPISTMKSLTLLKLLGPGEKNVLEERTIEVGKDKILDLLKFSLVSKSPLTEAFLELIPLNYSSVSKLKNGPGNVDYSQNMASSSTKTEETISLKLIINSVNNKVLYAEAANDFVNLLCSFLTFPIGFLFQKNLNLPFSGCMDNVYKSINTIEAELFKSVMMKDTLLESKLAPGLAQLKKVISIEDATNPTCRDLISHYKAERRYAKSWSCSGETVIANGFIKGPSSFMIMDNLAVMPLSSISGLRLIETMQIPFDKIVEKEVVMGENEAIRLFAASLVAENALTDVFLRDEIKQEEQGDE
ncbi:Protein kinase domain-containing protein [Heracleum sosnowskyi]|uniref:Protein kinase domain-containing protein n=1 Tax=Heracleum sosnowskyi TaxID=360622 RepID=A0AAD8IHE9_9APIA|nr:Protein kinase domain-containing protein [Heracleum sosnowskyi]